MTLSQKISKKEKTEKIKTAISCNQNKVELPQIKKTTRLRPQDKIFQDLEDMYQAAFDAKNFAVALRVLELRGRQLGLFIDKKPEPIKSLQEMSEQELQALLND